MDIANNSIILVNSSNKNRVIEYLCRSNILINRKIMTFNDFKKKLLFDYDEKAIYEIIKREKVSCSIAQLYLKNMYNIKDKTIKKAIELDRIRKYLEEENLIQINELFRKSIQSKKIYLWNITCLKKEEEELLKPFTYSNILNENNNREFKVYEADTLEDEVIFVANKITEFIKSGIDIKKIKLMNLSEEYKLYINKIFKIFGIPTNINIDTNIYSTKLSKIFLDEGIVNIEQYIKNSNDEKIVNKIIDTYNKFVWCSDEKIKKELIIESLKNTKIPSVILNNAIDEIDITCDIFEDEYVFILGFNQGIIPKIYKDEDYFSDKEKLDMSLSTSTELNQLEKSKVKYYLSKINNLIISYKKRSLTDIYYPSALLEELSINNMYYEKKYNHSHLYNKILLSKSLDNYYKFGVKNIELDTLYSNYKNISYNTYDNSYKGINRTKISNHFKEKLLLSYSSLDNYFRCGFRYYLQSVLKLNFYEETFMQSIGNLFHHILSKSFLSDFDFEKEWNIYVTENNIGNSNKEKFFLNKIKDELIFTINVINKQQEKSNLNEFFYEEKFSIHPTNEENVTFVGIIDKLAYTKIGDKYLAAIIDYKTGNPSLNLNYLPYGIDMQLPIYLYLAHHIDKLVSLDIVGFYLQKILHTEINYDPKISYEEQKRKNLMLQGFSINNESLLKEFDSTYTDSTVIKSMKTSSKGFYSYSKVLNKKEMDKICEIVERNIVSAINNIKVGDFSINPKRVNDKDIGCEFCSYKDICFKKERDIISLKEYKDLEFLGGDVDA